MPSGSVSIDVDGPIAVVTINRPQVRNALDTATIDALRQAALEVKQDARVRSVILTGAGDRAFVAGADIGELSRLSAAEGEAYARAGQQVFDLIEHLGKPVIAAVNGRALGGGCELALACHLRIAADTAAFGQPEVKLGLIPGFGGTQRLPRLVGKGRALELLLSGREVPAAEALAIGLVHRLAPAAELLPAARAWASELAGLAPLALAAVLDAVDRGLEMAFPEAQALEARLFGTVAGSEDGREGTRAFLEKRRPVFKGR
ncbi:MAG: short chain enoyl-CoA hydratase [Acidobacteria bacterium]|nr:short chain enoyl-CoA hydratase [Acidobacteriota bacterium]